MQVRTARFAAAIRHQKTWCRRFGRARAFEIAWVVSVLAVASAAVADQMAMPPADTMPAMDAGAPPISQSGDVSYFSQDLGTILRLRYNSRSYGQNNSGDFDIGTMQVVTMDDSSVFVDGQVRVSDDEGVGFNVGVGYRWMALPMYALDGERMEGVSVWVDGTQTDAGNFFPQIGFSYESLGEMWEVRANTYLPVGDQEQVGNFEPTGNFGFAGNSITEETRAVVDSSFFAADLELARRLGRERDAWGFIGPYFLLNNDDDAVGGRVGLRGYAYPDLLVQIAINHDEIFDTNAAFALTWFVGRTRTNFQPACSPADYMRGPVMRNDYVVIDQSSVIGGNALTEPDRSPLRVVHVDSDAAPGGDGTFENPFDELGDVNGGSQAGDIVLAHSGSTFNTSILLKNNQRFLGEGDDIEHTVNTLQEGTIAIPETSPGAAAGARPLIFGAAGNAVTIASDNEVANFDIDGNGVTTRGIATSLTSAGNENIHDINIQNTAGDGIAITHAGAATAAMNLNIEDIELSNIGGTGLAILADNSNAFTMFVDNSTINSNVTMDATGIGNFTLLFEDSTINTGNNEVAYQLRFTGEFTDDDADVTIRRNTITTGDNTAFIIRADDVGSKTITAQWQNNTFTNNSAAIDTVIMNTLDNSTLNATIIGNAFTNLNTGGDELTMVSNGLQAAVNLNLLDNSANQAGGANGDGFYGLHELNMSVFSVVDTANTFNDTRNAGTVTTDPNDGAFDNIGSVPTPTFP